MNREEQVNSILEAMAKLPKGNISYKNMRGKQRMYLQWREAGQNKSKYIKAADEELVRTQIEQRNRLQEQYRALIADSFMVFEQQASYFSTNVTTGSRLRSFYEKSVNLQERNCMTKLRKYLNNASIGRVCLIYGLRRTGKTTLLMQAISKLPEAVTAYIKIMPSDNMDKLNRDLKVLADKGYKYIFIDEVTLLEDFIESASLFSDVYAMMGMKIVLSGTDSLGFAIAAQDELYDRTTTIHTTFIPFREYSRLLGIHSVDEYIRYGGTFRAGETAFEDPELMDEAVSFRDDESTRRYIDTAIAKNIQHSLACYQDGSHFRNLITLYEKNELTNAINRIIEDMNHRFLLSVATKAFKSHDLGSISQIERKRAAADGTISILANIDKEAITASLMQILEIRNKNEQAVQLTDSHIQEIKQYLKLLDLIIPCPTESIEASAVTNNYLFAQPGMRYCQAQALVYLLMKDKAFTQYPIAERNALCNKLLEEVRGRILEEIVLLETIKSMPDKKVFKLYFAIGEYDMVIFDQHTLTCSIFEIKHTDKINPHQYRYLLDEEKCAMTQHEYGQITDKVVLYQGPEAIHDGIHYMNVVEYLEGL